MTYVALHTGIFGADCCGSQVALEVDSCSQPSRSIEFWVSTCTCMGPGEYFSLNSFQCDNTGVTVATDDMKGTRWNVHSITTTHRKCVKTLSMYLYLFLSSMTVQFSML